MAKTGSTLFKACRACRQKRARCDGETPCERCSDLGLVCVYDRRPCETKEKLREERAELQAREAARDIILEALATKQDDQETLIALWHHKPIEQIAEELIRRRQHQDGKDDDTAKTRGNTFKDGHDDNDDEANVLSDGLASRHPSISMVAGPFNGCVDGLDYAINENPQPPPNVSSPEDSKALSRADDGYEMNFPGTFPQWPCRSTETSPRSQSQWCGSSSYSPVLGRSERATFGAPFSFGQSAEPGPSGTQPNANTSSSMDGLVAEELVGEHWEMPGLTVMPYQFVREFIETFIEKQYTPFPMVRQDLFFADFMAGKKGYCSSVLVRIMCCLGCRIIGGYDADESYHARLGNRLFVEATELIKSPEGSECSIPNSQALGLMGLHQMGIGQYEEAQILVDEGVRRLDCMHRQADSDRKIKLLESVQATMLYGTISLARMTRLAIGHIMYSKPTAQRDGMPMTIGHTDMAKINAHVEQLLSQPDLTRVSQIDGDLAQLPTVVFQLTDWVYAFLSRSQVSADNNLPKHLRDTYHACLSWYSSTLARYDEHQGPEPFVHLYYHFCLLALFRPFCHVKSEDLLPARICLESADSILTLAKVCGQLDGFHILCFVPIFVYAAAKAEVDITSGQEELTSRCAGSSVASLSMTRGDSTASDATATGGSSSELSGNSRAAIRSLTDRALELLVELSDLYPSARKAASELQGSMSRRASALGW